MDNIKYPTFTGTNNEETTRQYDKDKLCTSSVWTFYSNAPIESKSSLVPSFRSLIFFFKRAC